MIAMTYQDLVEEFLRASKSPVRLTRSFHNEALVHRLIEEETAELLYEIRNGNPLEKLAKEAVDVLYVILNMCVMFGIDFDACFRAVHESNMSKAPFDRDEGGKIVKGPNYVPPNLEDICRL